jgi:hypothetical protein
VVNHLAEIGIFKKDADLHDVAAIADHAIEMRYRHNPLVSSVVGPARKPTVSGRRAPAAQSD